jgi:hypothetical protein
MKTNESFPRPEYTIGDTVFLLDGNKIEGKTVRGVVAIYDYDKKKFSHFKYYLNVSNEVSTYDWKQAQSLFRSKEDLIASL